jgi:hypothetical protein
MSLESVTFRWPKLRRADVKRDAWRRNAGPIALLRLRQLQRLSGFFLNREKLSLYGALEFLSSDIAVVFQRPYLRFQCSINILRHCAELLLPHAT